MIEINEETQRQLDLVRKKCEELDVTHPGIELVDKLDKALDYAARYADKDLEGKTIAVLTPDSYLPVKLPEDFELLPRHFSFMVTLYKPGKEGNRKYWFVMGMIYHNGAGVNDGSGSVELNPEAGPHWSFHS